MATTSLRARRGRSASSTSAACANRRDQSPPSHPSARKHSGRRGAFPFVLRLLLVAIDNLSRISDSYGFDIGDEVIGAVGKRIRALVRVRDTLGRYAGNKFGVVLRDCTPDDMAIAAERLLTRACDEILPTAAGGLLPWS